MRLFAATSDPSKALILNEPFEPISSSWRERVAELLTDYARNKNGLVVVASLSYRPDSWIDNAAIARHQVGQTLRRTIGFGGAGSESAQLMNQLREQILSEESQGADHSTPPPPAAPSFDNRRQAATASLGAAAMLGGVNTNEALESPAIEELEEVQEITSHSTIFTTLKAVTALGAGGLGVWAAVTLLGIQPPKEAPAPPEQSAVTQQDQAAKKGAEHISEPHEVNVQPPAQEQFAKEVAPPAPKLAFLLDRYPEAIRISILDTSRGIMGDPSQISAAAPPPEAQKPANEGGSFYKLLESAGSDKPDAGVPEDSGWQQPSDTGAWSAPEPSEPVEYNPAEEEERREAIRQKFLEAIRAAAERREEEGMGQ